MSRAVIQPDELDLETGGRRDYWVALEHDTMWGAQLIPVTVLVGPGAKPGQGLVAFGSTHGNEYEGPTAIKGLLREIPVDQVTGRIILDPRPEPGGLPHGDAGQRRGRRRQSESRVRGRGGPATGAGRDHAPHRRLRPRPDLAPRARRARPALGRPADAVRPMRELSPDRRPGAGGGDRRDGPLVRHAPDHDLPEPDPGPAHQRGRAPGQDHRGDRAGMGRGGALRGRALRPAGRPGRGDPARPAPRRDPAVRIPRLRHCRSAPPSWTPNATSPPPSTAITRKSSPAEPASAAATWSAGCTTSSASTSPRGRSQAPLDGIVVAQAWGARVRQGQFVLCVGVEQPW